METVSTINLIFKKKVDLPKKTLLGDFFSIKIYGTINKTVDQSFKYLY